MSYEDYSMEVQARQLADEFNVDEDGKGNASIRAAAILVGVTKQTLSKHLLSVSFKPSKLARMLMDKGFDPVSFSETGIPDTALVIIISYYAHYAGERCTEEAKKLADALLGVGVRVWMQKVKGWVPPAVEPVIEPTTAPAQIEPSAEEKEIAQVLGIVSKTLPLPVLTGIEINLREQFGLMSKVAADVARTALKEHISKVKLLTVTQVGARLNISPRTTNKLLISEGFQILNPEKSDDSDVPDYLATEAGLPYCHVQEYVGNNGLVCRHLRWRENIVSILRDSAN